MNRRAFVAGLGAVLAAPLVAEGQQPGHVYRVGCLMGDARESFVAQTAMSLLPTLLQGHGYVEGQNLTLEWRWGDGKADRLRELARDLVRRNVDVIVAISNGPIAAAKDATSTLPIVMMIGNVPVEAGFIHSLARPGGNITGTTYTPPTVAAKNLQLVKDFFTGTRRLTVIYDPIFPGMSYYKAELDRVAPSLGIAIHYVAVRRPDDFRLVVDAIDKARPNALAIVPTATVRPHLIALIRVALERKLPTFGSGRDVVDLGGVLYYGPSIRHSWERTVSYVDRILRGAKPSELPVEQPTRYELVINLKSAKAIGLTITPSLLLQADQVIE